mmetsp:Transcript_23130/g.32330  ORF Transcript_23130/g.32330 Transcript_23130/m.32330 type:complete len:115 (+) Transcript_23130:456-800(+)
MPDNNERGLHFHSYPVRPKLAGEDAIRTSHAVLSGDCFEESLAIWNYLTHTRSTASGLPSPPLLKNCLLVSSRRFNEMGCDSSFHHINVQLAFYQKMMYFWVIKHQGFIIEAIK